jgi:F0F1-type ATP synthase assembly protein I
MKRWVPLVVGILLFLIGGVWTGQGAGLITGSFMTGSKLWFLIGLLCLIAGIGLVITTVRKPRGKVG